MNCKNMLECFWTKICPKSFIEPLVSNLLSLSTNLSEKMSIWSPVPITHFMFIFNIHNIDWYFYINIALIVDL